MAGIDKVKKTNAMPKCIVVGVVLCVVLSLVGALCVALLIDGGRLPEEAIDYGALLLVLLSAFTGSFAAIHFSKGFQLPVALGVSGVYFVLLLSATALLFEGRYTGLAATALTVLLGSGCAILLAGAGNKRERNRFKKYRNR